MGDHTPDSLTEGVLLVYLLDALADAYVRLCLIVGSVCEGNFGGKNSTNFPLQINQSQLLVTQSYSPKANCFDTSYFVCDLLKNICVTAR